jgi:hypothetical protein
MTKVVLDIDVLPVQLFSSGGCGWNGDDDDDSVLHCAREKL